MTAFVLSQVLQPPVNSSVTRFGGSYNGALSLSGDRLAVGAWGTNGGVGSVHIFSNTNSTTWEEEATLAPNVTGPSGSFYGLSLSLSGERLAVGAPNDQSACAGNSYCGAVYVYERSLATGTWQPTLLLVDDPSPAAAALFGWSVALRGDTLVVGSYGYGGYTGRAHVFSFDSGGGASRSSVLSASDGAPSSNFGWSVELSAMERRLVVGAPRAFAGRGAAYVFERSSSSSGVWAEVTRLADVAGAALDRYGTSCALDAAADASGAPPSDLLLCGSKHKSTAPRHHNGAAFLYDAAANVSHVLQTLTPPSADGALNGGATALQAGLAVVAPYGAGCTPSADCVSNPDQGRVFVYRDCNASGATCTLAQTLTPPPSTSGADAASEGAAAGYGAAVALHGATFAIAAPTAGTSGLVYVYRSVPLPPPQMPPPQMPPSQMPSPQMPPQMPPRSPPRPAPSTPPMSPIPLCMPPSAPPSRPSTPPPPPSTPPPLPPPLPPPPPSPLPSPLPSLPPAPPSPYPPCDQYWCLADPEPEPAPIDGLNSSAANGTLEAVLGASSAPVWEDPLVLGMLAFACVSALLFVGCLGALLQKRRRDLAVPTTAIEVPADETRRV